MKADWIVCEFRVCMGVWQALAANVSAAEHSLGIHGNPFLADDNFHSFDKIFWASGFGEWSVAIHKSTK